MLSERERKSLSRRVNQGSSAIANAFDALGDWGRFRIFTVLSTRTDVCVTDIANILDITVPAASQQLKILETAGLVVPKRDGQRICYRLNADNEMVKGLIKLLETVVSSTVVV